MQVEAAVWGDRRQVEAEAGCDFDAVESRPVDTANPSPKGICAKPPAAKQRNHATCARSANSEMSTSAGQTEPFVRTARVGGHPADLAGGQGVTLGGVEVPGISEHDIGVDHRPQAECVAEELGCPAGQQRQSHAAEVAADGDGRGVEVAVRVQMRSQPPSLWSATGCLPLHLVAPYPRHSRRRATS
jgi:hypothetical protein